MKPLALLLCWTGFVWDATADPFPVSDAGASPQAPAGRLAIVVDGYSPDPDDIGATAVILGLLDGSNLNGRLVHLSHSCDLKPTRITAADERRRQTIMDQVCRDGLQHLGPFEKLAAAFNCRTQRQEAIDDLCFAIDESSVRDPLWIIEAGEPDIIGYALEAARPEKRQYVHVVSHHKANDDAGDVYSWEQILVYGVREHRIGDQNVRLKTSPDAWDWAKDHPLARKRWIWTQFAYAEQDPVVKFSRGTSTVPTPAWSTGGSPAQTARGMRKALRPNSRRC